VHGQRHRQTQNQAKEPKQYFLFAQVFFFRGHWVLLPKEGMSHVHPSKVNLKLNLVNIDKAVADWLVFEAIHRLE
jgi:hypothetical protein